MKLPTVVSLIIVALFMGCSAQHVDRGNINPDAFRQFHSSEIEATRTASPFLKAHMKNGGLYVFSSWNRDIKTSAISGQATLYGPDRQTLGTGLYAVGLDSVAILETNELRSSGAGDAIAVFTGITAAATIFCITNPKACFGSCPTFFASDGDSMRLQAEGFSSSICPSLEATDVDALYHARPSKGELVVEMTNEALETHVVRHADLLVVPEVNGAKVFHGDDRRFWSASHIAPPASASSEEGDCRSRVAAPDGSEYFSLADSAYLGTREIIELEFPILPGRQHGLIVGGRQTLMPTYLLYQALAYMGNEAGHWLAELERKRIGSDQGKIERMIGGIEVLVQDPDDQWHPAGTIDEHGPLAMDVHLVPLPSLTSVDGRVRIRLRLTKGAWRLDYLALAGLSGPVTPVRLHPAVVLQGGEEDPCARELLLDSTRVLVTLPGDRYILKYLLPDAHTEYAYFLESRGYYLEWIRKEWIEEENPILLAEMFYAPEFALRRLAPAFKRVEPEMENAFWRSRYAKP